MSKGKNHIEDYQNHSVEDFLMDEKFQLWIRLSDQKIETFFGDFLKEYPEKKPEIIEARDLLKKMEFNHGDFDLDVIQDKNWQEIMKKINPVSSPFLEIPRRLVKIAASVLLFSMVGLFYYLSQNQNQNQISSKVEVIEFKERENPRGQKSHFFLEDGTKVVLNGASKLSYNSLIKSDERVIFLEGEAYFEVAKDSERPFKVITENLKITALGTTLNIVSFPNRKETIVSLVEGKVKVEKSEVPNVSLELIPGEEAVFNQRENIFHKREFEKEAVLAWKDGIIYFKNADQHTIERVLEEWYNVNITMEIGNSKEWRITAKFDNESLEFVLVALSYNKGFDFSIEGQDVVIEY